MPLKDSVPTHNWYLPAVPTESMLFGFHRAGQAASGTLLQLQQLLSVSMHIAQLSEGAGAKPSQALRQALQLQCRAFLDHLHRSHISRLSGVTRT